MNEYLVEWSAGLVAWAADLASIRLRFDLVAIGRPSTPYGELLIEVCEAVSPVTAFGLRAEFPDLADALAESVLAGRALDWVEERVDEVAVLAIKAGQAQARNAPVLVVAA
jgi:hypothetical protein